MSTSLANVEAERTVLGAVLVDNAALPVVEPLLRSEHFSDHAHRAIFAAMCAMGQAGRQIDLVTLRDELGEQIGSVGGVPYLAGLLDGLPRVQNAAEWARIVRDRARRRAAAQLAQRLLARVASDDVSTDELLDEHQGHIGRLIDAEERGIVSLAEVLPEALRKLERFAVAKDGVTGLATGFPDVDMATLGLQPGALWIAAGRPSRGKSAFVAQVAVHAAQHGAKVLVLCMEMPPPSVAHRMLLSEGEVDRWDLRKPARSDLAWSRITHASSRLSLLPIRFDGRESPSLAQVRAACRQVHARYGLDLIVVDYLQRMSRDSKLTTWEGVAENTKGLKNLALALDVPVLAACQLTADAEESRPTLADLAQARQVISAEADVIAFLHPDQPKEWRKQEQPIVHFLIDKQRDGPTAEIKLLFDRPRTRFMNLAQQQWDGAL